MSDSALSAERLTQLREEIPGWLIKDHAKGDYRLDRQMFLDEDIFELEMKHIFEGNWVYVAHESQIAKPHDFLTTSIGRQPVIITRQADSSIGGFINVCAHRGARVCREKIGNKKFFACGFHGWTYNSSGKLVDVPDEQDGAYPENFDHSKLGLKPVARIEDYRGFIFASLNPDVLPLKEYLAGSRAFIDLLVDQSPVGKLEVLRGATHYTYKGNWKLQAENGLDGYHVNAVHGNYIMTTMRRMSRGTEHDTKVMDLSAMNKIKGGFFAFEHGHAVLWLDILNSKDRPNFEFRDHYLKTYGPQRTGWMMDRMRNMLLFPNVFLMDQASTQIRIIKPVSVNETEITTYCYAPVGESDHARALRIRQYEDFFNASGMATPDDLTEFKNCQIGFAARSTPYSDMSRGSTRSIEGVNEVGQLLGFDAVLTGIERADEGLYFTIHEDWMQRMQAAITQELGQ